MVVNKSEIIPLPLWNKDFSFINKPFLIAGPCSAESEKQLLDTAQKIKEQNIDNIIYFRAGLWKPRTRPDSFHGVGERGIDWLVKVRNKFGFKIITEAATPQHLEMLLKAGIDAIWVGARTTVNPFSVQELAEALKGVDIPVFIKNPINPDIELWIGAIERINKAGIKKIAAIHRGFSSYEKSNYRNVPQWQIPIDLKTYIPELTILCDPSHISGNAKYIFEISQQAMDLAFDGLMIETHINPQMALSDAKQQITPTQLSGILAKLIIRHPNSIEPKSQYELSELRRKIDMIDDTLLNSLEQRLKLVKQIGKIKQENDITILQSERWKEIITKILNNSEKKALNKDFVIKIFKFIHQESIKTQAQIMNKKVLNKSSENSSDKQ